MTEQEIQEQAEKMYPEYPTEPKGETRYNKDINCFKKRKVFISGAKWMQEQDELKWQALKEFLYEEIINRREYSASKSFEVVLEKIEQLQPSPPKTK